VPSRRCVTELGAVAIIGTPDPVNGQHLHDEACEPLWAEIERLGVPVGFHPHPIAHAIRNPVELMGALASMATGGVLETSGKSSAPPPGMSARYRSSEGTFAGRHGNGQDATKAVEAARGDPCAIPAGSSPI
jgi:hypothetical protein